MADEQKNQNGEGTPDEERQEELNSDSGLGNLPPLSDFDSASGLSSDSGLPPLSSFDDAAGGDEEGGLPPVGDIDMETPRPGGGKPRQAEFDSAGDAFSSGGDAGFQDMAADSDFSPETLEIGPGPEHDDTPMFDSAFGGADFDTGVDTPAPTQAMETPMFGGGQAPQIGGGGFDQDAFGGGFRAEGGGGFGGGTPPPDFSPDTNLMGGVPVGAGASMPSEPGGHGGRSGGMLAGFLIGAVIFALVGIIAGPYVFPSIPVVGDLLPENPYQQEVAKLQSSNQSLQSNNQRLQQQIREYEAGPKVEGGEEITQERLLELRDQIQQARGDLSTVEASLAQERGSLRQVEQELSDLNSEYLQKRDEYEDLRSETAIIRAQQNGLVREVERLTTLVGGLEEANARRLATKQSLAFAADRLYVQVRESIPLTPPQYDLQTRLAAIDRLRERIEQASYVTPELQEMYASIYLDELQRAADQQYFYARLVVTDRFGAKHAKWAECLMKGNWAVYYRTLDGKNIGMYMNLGDASMPVWGYREDLPPSVRKQLEDEVIASRVPDYQEKVAVLAEKELAQDDRSIVQRAFDSL